MRRLTSWVKALRASRKARLRAWRIAARNRSAASHCFYCGVSFTGTGSRQRTVDHRLPRALGGSDRLGNLVFACASCNQRKGHRPEEGFVTSAWLQERRRATGAEQEPGPGR